MKSIILIIAFCFTVATGRAVIQDQYPSSGDDMLAGAKMWAKIMAHKCSDGDCKHYSIEDLARGVAAFDFLKGYLHGFRTAQIATQRKAILFPEEGVDCQTLIAPLIDFLQKNEKARSEHVSLSLFFFLRERYPSPK